MRRIFGFIQFDNDRIAAVDLGATAIRHAESGCTITADATLYYRAELLSALGLEVADSNDAEIILAAYLRWGENCVDHLDGDYAFAIWDKHNQKLFCARDRFGMRRLYYHFEAGSRFILASDARAVVALPEVPFAINEGRIADFIVQELEWIDYTSTFYEHVFRLPPAHKLIVSPEGLRVTEYWAAKPGPELSLSSDEEYRGAFLDVFTRAVRERLRVPDNAVGSMLSGGMDSGSVVATASSLLRSCGVEDLHTYSLANPRGTDCVESERIYATLDHQGLDGTQITPEDIDDYHDKLVNDLEEPYDGEMLFAKAIYLAARRDGISVVLDGAGGDVVFNEGRYIARLIRSGRLVRAWHEIAGERLFWGDASVIPGLLRHLRAGIVPEFLKRPFRGARHRQQARHFVRASLISRDLADRIHIEARCERLRETFSGIAADDPKLELARKIRPNLTAGRERYGRIATAAGIEARDPFTDSRVVDFCTRLPGRMMLRNGWPKFLLREAMQDKLPETVVWGRGKPHIGGQYNRKFIEREISQGALDLETLVAALEGYVDVDALRMAWRAFREGGNADPVHSAYILSTWLQQSVTRPVVKDQRFR